MGNVNKELNDRYSFVDNQSPPIVYREQCRLRKDSQGNRPQVFSQAAGLLIAATHLQVYDTSIAMGTSMFQACVFTECSVITDFQFNNGD